MAKSGEKWRNVGKSGEREFMMNRHVDSGYKELGIMSLMLR